MSLARAWTRQLYGASGAAVLAPARIIAALAVPAVGGDAGTGGSGGRRPPVAPPPSRPPAPAPTLIDRVVGLGTAVTSRVPGPVGTLGTRVRQSPGTTLDRIVPPVGQPPATPAAPRALLGIRLP